jgi:hypothetical protein
VRPILPYTNHPLANCFKKGGAALGYVVKQLPSAEQFTITSAAAVPNRLIQWRSAAQLRWGSKFKWITMVGDISNMYDELDPEAAASAVKSALLKVPVWAKRRVLDRVNMTRGGNDVLAGAAVNDNRVVIEFEILLDMCIYDCNHTYYRFRGKVNRRKFGVPMGGFMSPSMAIIMCAMVEILFMDGAPDDLVGGVMRYMDDVLGIVAVSTAAEEAAARAWFKRIATGYPKPLVLNVEPEADRLRFLELEILVAGCDIYCGLFNTLAEATRLGKLALQRVPDVMSGSLRDVKRALVTGFVHRAIDGASDDIMILRAVLEYRGELLRAGWNPAWLSTSLWAVLAGNKLESEDTRGLLALLGKVI